MTYSNRVAVITGGGQGIGASIATTLASKGDAVAVLDMNPDAARETALRITEEGGRAIAVTCDVSDVKQVEESISHISEDLGPPNILVNNAGVTRDNLVFKMTDEDWDAVIATHLTGSFYVTRAVQHHMVSQKYGKIVFISSRASLGNRGQANYSAAKAGMIGMMKTLAIELGPFNVNVNAIAPGHITTDMTQGTAERLGQDYEEMKRRSIAMNAIKRVGVPQDVADAVEYLASDRASYVTGQVLYVTGRPTV
jgi:3-oxoacyl-[acyl-carrier protein] reductase